MSKKILIATGIYPPDIGGPSQYAFNINKEFKNLGYLTKVVFYKIEKKVPTGLRHLFFFIKIIPKIIWADFIIALDQFSVGLPTVLATLLLRKKVIIRTGGDFLWESFVERTGEKVLFKNFYKSSVSKFTLKEKIIFKLSRFALQNCYALVFSTRWQMEIFSEAYNLDPKKNFIIENYYGEKILAFDVKGSGYTSPKKVFIAGTRKLKWKNLDMLKRAFDKAKIKIPEIELDLNNYPYDIFIDKIKNSYAVILTSLGDISPNMILDSIICNKPFILTNECGILDRVGSLGVLVSPLDCDDIERGVIELVSNYERYTKKVSDYNFTHSWRNICEEFLEVAKKFK